MKLFYIAVDAQGKKVKGFIEASDTARAALFLRERSLVPVRIEKEQVSQLMPSISVVHKIKSRDVIFFTRQLSTMLSSGLTLTQSLSILKNQVHKQNMLSLIEGIITNIEEGKSFSETLALYPNIFSPVYISLIRASETAGLLDKVMLRLSESLEKRDILQSKIKGALVYPIIVIILMIIVTLIMMLFVVPQLSTLYTSMNIQMPLPTVIIISLSEFVSKYILYIIIVTAILILYFNKWRVSEKGKKIYDSLLLKLPIFGKLIQFSLLTEFARTFGLLVGTGALIIEALQKSADVMGNVIYKNAVINVAHNVEKGVSIGDAMSMDPLFPPILVEMVKVGEKTGKLDDSLMRVSDYFEREDEQIVKTLTSAMEPFIMVMLAIGVGFLIISIITPIYNLLSAFQ